MMFLSRWSEEVHLQLDLTLRILLSEPVLIVSLSHKVLDQSIRSESVLRQHFPQVTHLCHLLQIPGLQTFTAGVREIRFEHIQHGFDHLTLLAVQFLNLLVSYTVDVW